MRKGEGGMGRSLWGMAGRGGIWDVSRRKKGWVVGMGMLIGMNLAIHSALKFQSMPDQDKRDICLSSSTRLLFIID